MMRTMINPTAIRICMDWPNNEFMIDAARHRGGLRRRRFSLRARTSTCRGYSRNACAGASQTAAGRDVLMGKEKPSRVNDALKETEKFQLICATIVTEICRKHDQVNASGRNFAHYTDVTPLHEAVLSNSEECVRLLLESGARPSPQGMACMPALRHSDVVARGRRIICIRTDSQTSNT
jgi:hypothetical protein